MSSALIGRLIAAVIFLALVGVFYTQFTQEHARTWEKVMDAVGLGDGYSELNAVNQPPAYGKDAETETPAQPGAGEG
ncbi:hypothetical protein [Rhodovibrio salinarum]|uniref:Uncharacterized protein n=1 Tax=Rhodovibrio salinarum TaxID=1087 RepID=A0A934QHW7_9PROT|nr:hypothetical protein [Rhodovibrio salinarum]MBK1697072.1 hypothetical protein [Rhodovibrio salinarum]